MAARGEPAPKTWPSGLTAAERIKEEREKAANPDSAEDFIDELQWKQNVTDLHRVMEVSKSLWLLLEHSNEAMVRTALEIALDKSTKKVLWWPDFWFSDHDKREHFKEIVRVKLAVAIANAKGAAVDLSEFSKGDEGDSELVQGLRRQIAELEAALRAARAQQVAAEARCRELEEAAAEAANRLKALEQAMEKMRQEVKGERAVAEVAPDNSAYEDEIRKLKQQLKMGEEQKAKLEEIIKQLKKELEGKGQPSAVVEKSDNSSELQMAQRRIEELEKQLKQARAELAKLQKQKPGEKVEKVTTAVSDDSELRALQEELEAERRRREELEEELRKAQEKIDLMKKEIELEKKRAADLQAEMKRLLDAQQGYKPPAAAEVAAPQEVVQVTGMSPEQLAELEELRRIAADYDKLKAKLKKRDQQIASLQEENEKLNEEQMKLLKMLKQVREQLRIVMELAEKKGLGDVIKKLFEEAGLADTMADPEYTCFDRLYDDALRRMDKQRRLEWYRMGNTGEPPPSFKGRMPYRKRDDLSPVRGAGGPTTGASEVSAGGMRMGLPTHCRKCGYPLQEGPYDGAQSLSSPSPPPVYRSPSPYESAGHGSHGGYGSHGGQAMAYGQEPQQRQRSPSNGPQRQQGRSHSPQTAHAIDMRIEMVKPAGEGHIGTAVVTFSDQDAGAGGWDPYGGRRGGQMGQGGMHAMRDVGPFGRDGGRGQPTSKMGNLRGRPTDLAPPMSMMGSPQHAQSQQLDPLVHAPKGRSRSPPDKGPQRMPGSASRQRVGHSGSERGNLPRLPADMMSPSQARHPGRSLAGSSSAAELRRGDGLAEGPLPMTGHGPGRMRGVMLVENSRSLRYGGDIPGAEDFAPRMMWRPHKIPSSDVHYKGAAGSWSHGGDFGAGT